MNTVWILLAIGAAAAAFFLRTRRAPPPQADPQVDPDSLRHLELGNVAGVADRCDTHVWRGLPYAQPPVGPLRWKAPRPPAGWNGLRKALAHGPFATQFAGITVESPESEWDQVAGSEDCLTLNVFAPRWRPHQVPKEGARLPVMFWIHGGANTSGTAGTYDMLRNLAGQDQVIVVSANYRLGIFGWFSLEELHEEGDSPLDRSGNFGTLDLIAALEWVRQHIAAFGGDPGNVTVFGESAGGMNIYSLLASPLAKGLFHKAILQSPLAATCTLAQARNFSDDARPGQLLSSRELLCKWLVADGTARDRGAAKAALAGMTPQAVAAYVRAKSASELLEVITPGPLGFYPASTVFRDGVVIPDAPLLELLSDRARYNAVPVIVGCNRDEYKTFMSQNPEYVRMVMGKIPLMRNVARYQRDAAYMSDMWKASAVDEPASAMLASGNPDVWAFRFDWDEQPAIPLIRPDILLGAAHVLEMAFVFRDLDGEFDPFKSNTQANLPGRRVVSDAMAGYWTAFARSGAPHVDGALPEWKRWNTEVGGSKLMLFDSPAGGGVRMVSTRLTVEGLERRLAVDSAFADARDRCAMHARMFHWSIFAGEGDTTRMAAFATEAGGAWRVEDFRPAHWP